MYSRNKLGDIPAGLCQRGQTMCCSNRREDMPGVASRMSIFIKHIDMYISISGLCVILSRIPFVFRMSSTSDFFLVCFHSLLEQLSIAACTYCRLYILPPVQIRMGTWRWSLRLRTRGTVFSNPRSSPGRDTCNQLDRGHLTPLKVCDRGILKHNEHHQSKMFLQTYKLVFFMTFAPYSSVESEGIKLYDGIYWSYYRWQSTLTSHYALLGFNFPLSFTYKGFTCDNDWSNPVSAGKKMKHKLLSLEGGVFATAKV